MLKIFHWTYTLYLYISKNIFRDKLMEHGICVRIIGNLSLIPEDICKLIAKAMIMTKDNKKAFLNVAFAYTCK